MDFRQKAVFKIARSLNYSKRNGRDRDRTDDLYRVNINLAIRGLYRATGCSDSQLSALVLRCERNSACWSSNNLFRGRRIRKSDHRSSSSEFLLTKVLRMIPGHRL